jgi:hypothetical protein
VAAHNQSPTWLGRGDPHSCRRSHSEPVILRRIRLASAHAPSPAEPSAAACVMRHASFENWTFTFYNEPRRGVSRGDEISPDVFSEAAHSRCHSRRAKRHLESKKNLSCAALLWIPDQACSLPAMTRQSDSCAVLTIVLHSVRRFRMCP